MYSDARRAGRNTDGAGGLNKNPTIDNGLVAAQVRSFLLSPAARNDTLVQLQPLIGGCCVVTLSEYGTSAVAACPRPAEQWTDASYKCILFIVKVVKMGVFFYSEKIAQTLLEGEKKR